ncbi:DUF2905 domain-containing protein [Nostoc sp. 106C]|uniref:DUF2905 domain-containing protein n=1 Tax=Nostoc sp. 106C TaxID=1932667 RepID=UPI000A36041E|nr:DUF2905 domain-containing protein [Nostoc sp. 106C]OUL25013.1 hypothetical protein BV375_23305 [Nostoc sp. 106C]
MKTIARIIGSAVTMTIVGLGLRLLTKRLSWYGNLPGDIRIVSSGSKVYLPFTTLFILNIGFSLLMRLLDALARFALPNRRMRARYA